MTQRAAIVTGGSSGIGLEIARMLLQEGYGVTVASRRPDKLEQAVADLSGDGRVAVGHSATKAGVIGFTEAMNRELGQEGIKSCALCPTFVDTPMADFIKKSIPAQDMIRPQDMPRPCGAAARLPCLRDPRDRVPAARRHRLITKGFRR